jgi:hypothetical protein
MRKRTWLIVGVELLLVFVVRAWPEVVPNGTDLEIRLATPVGSHSSHAGDPVKAVVIAPVEAAHELVFLQGAVLTGTVEESDPLGLGLKRRTAELRVCFDRIQLPDGAEFPIGARLREIENAREHVGREGEVVGIDPAANVSSGMSLLMSTVLVHSELEVAAIAVKLLLARSPDSEIYLPRGTELFLELTRDLVLDRPHVLSLATPGLSSSEVEAVQSLLGSLPLQQAELAPHHSSDLTNILLLGTKEQVDTVFRAAGWSGESKHSAVALYRMYHGLVQRMGYSLAPMSRMTLNGRPQSRTYQKSLDTLAKRHHVRFWKQADKDVWLGAASEDVALKVRRMHITHAIDEDIDNERAKVINDLWLTGCVDEASLLPRETLKNVLEDGYPIHTDGDLAVLRLRDCKDSVPTQNSQSMAGHVTLSQAFGAVENDILRANPATTSLALVRSVRSILRVQAQPHELAVVTPRRASVLDKPPAQLTSAIRR